MAPWRLYPGSQRQEMTSGRFPTEIGMFQMGSAKKPWTWTDWGGKRGSSSSLRSQNLWPWLCQVRERVCQVCWVLLMDNQLNHVQNHAGQPPKLIQGPHGSTMGLSLAWPVEILSLIDSFMEVGTWGQWRTAELQEQRKAIPYMRKEWWRAGQFHASTIFDCMAG